jgi:RNA polymerase sigma factor for flagellar operon FliA
MATSPVSAVPAASFAVLPPFSWTPRPLAPARPPAVTTPRNPQGKPAASSAAIPAPAVAVDPATRARDREAVLLEHLPLVRILARKIHERLPQHVELDDLISAGVVGLMDAYNKFDGAKNVQFRSYAQFRVRGAILDSLRDLDWGSRDLRRKGRAVEEARRSLTQTLGRAPSEAEIAAEVGMPLQALQELLGELKSLEIGSLHELRSEDSAEEELAFVPAAEEEGPLFRCMQSERAAQLCAALAEIPEREARVLSMYYVEEMTLKQIGQRLGLVESRVSQIRAAAIASLRSRMMRSRKPAAGAGRLSHMAGTATMAPPRAHLAKQSAGARF